MVNVNSNLDLEPGRRNDCLHIVMIIIRDADKVFDDTH